VPNGNSPATLSEPADHILGWWSYVSADATHHDITLTTDTHQASELLDSIVPVYEEVYAEPPYEEGPRDVAHFIERYRYEHRVPGFRIATSCDASGDVSAFAYGLPLSSSTSWWDGIRDNTSDPEFTREDGRRTFVIMELAVRAAHRRMGMARELHASLVQGNSAERFTLAVRPEAVAAIRLYSGLGYESIGTKRPWDSAPLYQYMLRYGT
jgi:ribosomal protein S18 acetylase RimI-like enzyme